jgi:hypothetical protein
LTAFSLKILDNVSSIGSGAGIAASSRRGSASKGNKVSNLYKYFNIFLTIPGIFGPSLVIIYDETSEAITAAGDLKFHVHVFDTTASFRTRTMSG